MSTKPSPTPEYAIKRCDFVTQELWHVTRNEKWICLCNTRDSAVAICNTMNHHERLVKALREFVEVVENNVLYSNGSQTAWALKRARALLSELEQEEKTQ